MKKLVLATMVAIMAFSGAALAQGTIGVYFDQGATDMALEVSSITLLHAYCIATDIPGTGIAGFEVQITADAPLIMSNFVYPAESGAINLQTPPTFLVGFSSPLPVADGALTLVDFDVIVSSANPVNWNYYTYNAGDPNDNAYEARIGVQEIFFHSLEEPVPAYLDENGEILPLGIAVSPEYRHQAWSTVIGQFGPVATDEVSFDGVKSLFR